VTALVPHDAGAPAAGLAARVAAAVAPARADGARNVTACVPLAALGAGDAAGFARVTLAVGGKGAAACGAWRVERAAACVL
jgi:hypothetical protein